MAKKTSGRKNKQIKQLSRKKEEEEFNFIQKRIQEYDPVEHEKHLNYFSDLAITKNTLSGLNESSFVSLTDIQKKSIPMALKGEDIMATARTGSGKTLAFLVPTIEALIRNNITEYDGLAALIVSPTRELAIQIFEVLTKIGAHNPFSAALVTGGKNVKYEMERVSRMNILVGTPGRISQHLNESVGLDTSNLQVLVLDEADRCLDMGFKKQIDSIIGHLPPTRQTLLFSATQSNSVKDLARLSLTNPRRIGVSTDEQVSATPESLDQYYIKVPLDEKLDVLWSFIKSHLNSKLLVFFSSLKQVQYAYETFRKLQPGMSLMKLYGRNKQTSRLETTIKFSQAQHACLFATDIVARGLDFPTIDWVIQVDCPEDAATYVHRVGRAARFGREGKSLLMLLPSEEEGFLKRLSTNKIDVKFMNVKQKTKKSIRPQLQSLCFQDPMLKNLGQRAFISYYKSVYIQKDKDVFKIEELPAEKYAESLGLPGAPKIKLKGGTSSKEKKNESRKLQMLAKANEDGEVQSQDNKKVRTKYDRMFERKNQTVLSDNYLSLTGNKAKSKGENDDEDDEDDFMVVKRQDHNINETDLPELNIPVSKRQAKKAVSKKALLASKGNATKLRFDDDGEAHPIYELQDEEEFKKQGDAETQREQFLNEEAQLMNQADIDDKLTAKQKREEKKRRRKEIEKRVREEEEEYSGSDDNDEGGETIVTLGAPDLDNDLQSSSEEEEVEQPKAKKPKWFETNDNVKRNKPNDIVEVDEPETLQDLEALTSKLINQ